MKLQTIIDKLKLQVLTEKKDFSAIEPQSGYASDLLSCVMAGAKKGSLWITLQAHSNIVAVAALLELGAIIITEGATPDDETIAKANEEGVILLSTNEQTFEIIYTLHELGFKSSLP